MYRIANGKLPHTYGHEMCQLILDLYTLSSFFSPLANVKVCIVATGVVGDICRALERDMLPYCQHIMGWLMANLEGASINRYVLFFCESIVTKK